MLEDGLNVLISNQFLIKYILLVNIMNNLEKIREINDMADEEKQKLIESKKAICICGTCNIYNDCANDANELVYCIIGKSPECIQPGDAWCVCGICPVAEQLGLKKNSFCLEGSETEQRGL